MSRNRLELRRGRRSYHRTVWLLAASLSAVPWTGQADGATLKALISRLSQDDDPPWLVGDIIGALTALTGERFEQDETAWRAWWEKRRRAASGR